MDTYIVPLNLRNPTLKQRAVAVLLGGGIFFILLFGRKMLWPTMAERNRGIGSVAIEAGIVSLLWTISMAFLHRKWPNCKLPNYKLLVDDESITAVMEYTGWMKWFVTRRTISKGKVRSAWEVKGRLGRPGGMGFSERSKLGARMSGFVYLPATLPEYEYLKRLAESWRTSRDA